MDRAVINYLRKQRERFISDKEYVVELLSSEGTVFDIHSLEVKLEVIEANIKAIDNQLKSF